MIFLGLLLTKISTRTTLLIYIEIYIYIYIYILLFMDISFTVDFVEKVYFGAFSISFTVDRSAQQFVEKVPQPSSSFLWNEPIIDQHSISGLDALALMLLSQLYQVQCLPKLE
jgi:hypothetical protein